MQGKELVQAALLAQNEVDSGNKQRKLRRRNFAKTFCELNFIQRDNLRNVADGPLEDLFDAQRAANFQEPGPTFKLFVTGTQTTVSMRLRFRASH
jgi:hypothetical protein